MDDTGNEGRKAGSEHESLRDFNAYADRNGQDFGQDSPLDVARPADLQRALQEDRSSARSGARPGSPSPAAARR